MILVSSGVYIPNTMRKIDLFDRKIINALQRDGNLTQRELAERVGLSANACWNRVRQLRENGILIGNRTRLDRNKLGLDLVVFVMLRTRHHSGAWLEKFRRHVSGIPEVTDFCRIGGDYDYLLKVTTYDMNTYDQVYRRLIVDIEFDSVTSYFVMEAIEEERPLLIESGKPGEIII